ncbi:MAG: alanine--tRNA ligase, partial [Candidatus Aenigmarchaeota archaeon]|nr:alanine--tRNA ligase [Candidatus Aenigmarchaeota archaeon]
IVSIGNLNSQACGGTHVDRTKDVGYITIIKTKRIQDGVVRIEFCSGEIAEKYLREKADLLRQASEMLNVSEDKVVEAAEGLFNKWKELRKRVKR